MKIEKVLSFKELKEMTKEGDVIIRGCRELMVKGGKSDKSIYVRLSVKDDETLRVWRGIDGVGVWITLNFGCVGSHSIFITRGYATFIKR